MFGGTFKTGEPSLLDLLERIHRRAIQLPDFQRGWVWDDDHIRSLIASVSMSFPIGAVMFLQTGGAGVRFKARPLEGAPEGPPAQADVLILDGQQRMTSLYLALRSGKPVPTRTDKGQDIERVYYLDIAKCLDEEADRVDAVVSLPVSRMRLSDFARQVDLDVSTTDKEFEAGYFPLDLLFDQDRFWRWREGYRERHRQDEKRRFEFDAFESRLLDRFRQYRVPTIELDRETPREAVCQVFEKVNTGGVSLTVFELVTATFAAEEYELRKDWELRAKRLPEHKVLADVDATMFLATVSLIASYRRHKASATAVSAKRRDILKLTLEEYKQFSDQAEKGLEAASQLLVREKVFEARNLPYQTQLIPLGAICAVLGPRFDLDPVKQKLARWYWCGVFGELYGGANETRIAQDMVDVLSWIDGASDEPRSIKDANFAPTRLLGLQTRQSAAYKGLMARLMLAGAHDFLNGDSIEVHSYFARGIDIHHVFPAAYCEKAGLDRARWNSVVNKAPLSYQTNRALGGHAPSRYLAGIETKHGIEPSRLDEILTSHLIDPLLLRAEDFDAFIRLRAGRLLDLIEKATGKAVAGRDSEETIRAYGGQLLSLPQATPVAVASN